MSFGESMFLAGFIHKMSKVDPIIRLNHVYPRRNRLRKTLEHSKRQTTLSHNKSLPCGADQPHLQDSRPVGPTCQSLLRTLFPHRLWESISPVAQCRFKSRDEIEPCYMRYGVMLSMTSATKRGRVPGTAHIRPLYPLLGHLSNL